MPSLDKITGTIVAIILLLNMSGHGDLVWKGIAIMRHHALTEARKPWGCPSIFNKNACDYKHR